MGHAIPMSVMTVDEFLAWDADQTERREFVAGEIFAMAGAEDSHVTACGNLYMALRQHLCGTPRRAYMADMKLRVEAADSIFYPDVLVTCSDADRDSRLVKREPVLIVEVLSPSTAGYDLGAKFACYRQLASLQEYLVVDVVNRQSTAYRKGADGLWVLNPFGPEDAVVLASVELSITPEVLFAEIDPPKA